MIDLLELSYTSTTVRGLSYKPRRQREVDAEAIFYPAFDHLAPHDMSVGSGWFGKSLWGIPLPAPATSSPAWLQLWPAFCPDCCT